MRYKVIVITGGVRCAASRQCGRREAESIGRRLKAALIGSIIDIVKI